MRVQPRTPPPSRRRPARASFLLKTQDCEPSGVGSGGAGLAPLPCSLSPAFAPPLRARVAEPGRVVRGRGPAPVRYLVGLRRWGDTEVSIPSATRAYGDCRDRVSGAFFGMSSKKNLRIQVQSQDSQAKEAHLDLLLHV